MIKTTEDLNAARYLLAALNKAKFDLSIKEFQLLMRGIQLIVDEVNRNTEMKVTSKEKIEKEKNELKDENGYIKRKN